jgi:signal transduction histidine kinase
VRNRAIFLLSALLLAVAVAASWYVHKLFADFSEVLDLNVASIRAAEELEIGLREIRTQLTDYAFQNHDPRYLEAISAQRKSTDHWLAEAERLATTGSEQRQILRIKRGYRDLVEQLDQVQAGGPESLSLRAVQRLVDEVLSREIIEPAHEYLDYNETRILSVARDHRVFSRSIAGGLLVIGISGAFAGFLAGRTAARRHRRSMIELSLPLSVAAGKLSEVVGPIQVSTGLDLAELKQILDALAVEVEKVVGRLQRTQQEVIRAEKLASVGQLAAGMAHEIRNPLMAVKLLVQSALEAPGVAQLERDDLCLIDQELSRLERTVQGLIDYARPPALKRAVVSTRTLVQQTVSLLAGRAAIQGVALEPSLGVGDVFVEGDAQQLQQVLLNLLINALDATERGGGVRIWTETDAQSVRICIADDGTGIPAELLDRIFEPFTSGKQTGTGLGLSISRRIVEAHCGEILAANRAGGGAQFSVLLPILPLEAAHARA